MSNELLKDYVVVVSGAGTGIGFATAQQFVAGGATVIGTGRTEKTLQEARQKIGEHFIPKACDVSDEKQIASLSEYVRDSFGKLDALVNNAAEGRPVVIEEMQEDDFYYHYNVIIKGPMLSVKHFAPYLKKSSNASIVNVGSISSMVTLKGHIVYGSAKAALVKFTQHLVKELPGVRSNVILVGLIDTPVWDRTGMKDDLFKALIPLIPCGRIGRPEDVAHCITFLCSEKGSYVNGASLLVDGGFVYGVDRGL